MIIVKEFWALMWVWNDQIKAVLASVMHVFSPAALLKMQSAAEPVEKEVVNKKVKIRKDRPNIRGLN